MSLRLRPYANLAVRSLQLLNFQLQIHNLESDPLKVKVIASLFFVAFLVFLVLGNVLRSPIFNQYLNIGFVNKTETLNNTKILK